MNLGPHEDSLFGVGDDSNSNHSAGRERWLVSYADFITLLFAFFVVLFAASNQNLEKLKEFQESVRKNLGLTGVGLDGAGGAAGGGGAVGQDQAATNIPVRQQPISTGLPTLRLDVREMEEALLELLEKHTGSKSSEFILGITQNSSEYGKVGLKLQLSENLFRPVSENSQGQKSADLGTQFNPAASKTLLALGEWVKKLELNARFLTSFLPGQQNQQWMATQAQMNLLGRYFLRVHQWGSQLEAIEWRAPQNLISEAKPGGETLEPNQQRQILLTVNSN